MKNVWIVVITRTDGKIYFDSVWSSLELATKRKIILMSMERLTTILVGEVDKDKATEDSSIKVVD